MTLSPSLSTDQIAAFVELAHRGSLRAAAKVLHISEQGVRNRLIALERELDVSLYHKIRGMRQMSPLTREGERLLPEAIAFLRSADALRQVATLAPTTSEVNVVASQYLATYMLIGAVQEFHTAHPMIRVRLSVRTELEVERALLDQPSIEVGLAAPYEPSAELEYRHLFSMPWSLITPVGHPLSKRSRIRLEQLADLPLILYEQGSTGRQHVIDAFFERDITPRVEMEATTTDVIVRMVEAELGVSIVPLMASGSVTRGRRVAVIPLGRQVRPIMSGVLTKCSTTLSIAAAAFVDFGAIIKTCVIEDSEKRRILLRSSHL